MSKYSQGYKLENRLVNDLKDLGFIAVWRSAGSHSPIDITALDSEGCVHLFQLKKTKTGRFNKKEFERFKELPCAIGVFKHYWVWQKGVGWIFRWSEDEEIKRIL